MDSYPRTRQRETYIYLDILPRVIVDRDGWQEREPKEPVCRHDLMMIE